MVYDVQDRGSFENISNWMSQIEQYADVNVTRVLVANKCDADPAKVQISEAEGQALADQYGIKFFLTSAKGNVNVGSVFEMAARDVVARLKKERSAAPPVVIPNPGPVDITKQPAGFARGGGGAAGGPAANCCKG